MNRPDSRLDPQSADDSTRGADGPSDTGNTGNSLDWTGVEIHLHRHSNGFVLRVPGLGLMAGGRDLDNAWRELERRYQDGATEAAAVGLKEVWHRQARQGAAKATPVGGTFGRFLLRTASVMLLLGVALLPAGWVLSGAIDKLSGTLGELKAQMVWGELDEGLERTLASVSKMPDAQRARLLANLRGLSEQLAPFMAATGPLWQMDDSRAELPLPCTSLPAQGLACWNALRGQVGARHEAP